MSKKTVGVYVRRIGERVCATFDNTQFWMAGDADEDEMILKAASISESDLPCDSTMPVHHHSYRQFL